MLNFQKSVLMKKQTHLHLDSLKESKLTANIHLGWTIPLRSKDTEVYKHHVRCTMREVSRSIINDADLVWEWHSLEDSPPGQLKALVLCLQIYELVWGLCVRHRACISALSLAVLDSSWHPIWLSVSPLPPVSLRTRSSALSTLALSVTLSRSVLSLGEAAARSLEAPGSVRHAAITWKPRRSSCRAASSPKPLSQPVTRTCFSWMPVIWRESRKNQTAATSARTAREQQQQPHSRSAQRSTCGGRCAG